ncbi:MAG: TIGR00159 family protein [Rhodothermales bacterium]|nr:TIGR00159 family protein [Rhodothermales bacterium]
MTLFQWVIPIRLIDIVEILIFAYILYKLYVLMRGTIAVQIFIGVLALFLVQFLVTLLNMRMLGSLFGLLSEVFVLAVIILFQPEIRRLLLALGQNPLVRRLVRMPEHEALVSEVVDAVSLLSRQRVGCLVAFERGTGLRSYIETGTPLQAKVTSDLIVTIFFAQNPLHDGAVIIKDRKIEAARCILPVSTSMKLSPHLGLRHRAAVGLTELTDAFVIVVSEETGRISFSTDGHLETNVSIEELHGYLGSILLQQASESRELEVAEV